MSNLTEIMKNATTEQLQKAAACKTAEEFLALAKTEGIELTPEEAEVIFKKTALPTGELSDEEMDAVAGGEIESRTTEYMCPYCFSSELGFNPFNPSFAFCRSCGKSFRADESAIKSRHTVYRCPKCKSHNLGGGFSNRWVCLDCGTQFTDDY